MKFTNHTPPQNEVLGGVYWFHSVRLSVRPSVRPLVNCALNELINEFDPQNRVLAATQYLPQQIHIRCVHSPHGEGVLCVELGGVVR